MSPIAGALDAIRAALGPVVRDTVGRVFLLATIGSLLETGSFHRLVTRPQSQSQ